MTTAQATMPLIVVTGFGPFGDRGFNASWEVARHVVELLQGHARTSLIQLPVHWDAVAPELSKIAEEAPSLVVCLGESDLLDSSPAMETVAFNDQVGTDDTGDERQHDPVVPGGKLVVIAPEVNARSARAVDSGMMVSTDAGRFVCNTTAYHGLSLVAGERLDRFAFVHVPAYDVHDDDRIVENARSIARVALSMVSD